MTSNAAQMGDWLAAQRTAFESLAGCSVSRWHGIEMALRDHTPSGPLFDDPGISFLQLVQLTATVGPKHFRTVATYQDDAYFGLRISDSATSAARTWDGIYRETDLDLPVGLVESVEIRFDEGTLAEVSFVIGEASLLLIAAEVYEANDGTLDVHRFDESVLAFSRPSDALAVNWVPARHG